MLGSMGKLGGHMSAMSNEATSLAIESDFNELFLAASKLAGHLFDLASGGGFVSITLKYLASFAAIYLLVLDRTNWRTNILTSLLVPYIFLSLPSLIFFFLSGEFGKWVCFIGVVLRLFCPQHFPEWLEMPGALILLLVAAPSFFTYTIRDDGLVAPFICLAIGCYLLHEHIQASGGFRNALTQTNGITNTVGILLLLALPIWTLVLHFL